MVRSRDLPPRCCRRARGGLCWPVSWPACRPLSGQFVGLAVVLLSGGGCGGRCWPFGGHFAVFVALAMACVGHSMASSLRSWRREAVFLGRSVISSPCWPHFRWCWPHFRWCRSTDDWSMRRARADLCWPSSGQFVGLAVLAGCVSAGEWSVHRARRARAGLCWPLGGRFAALAPLAMACVGRSMVSSRRSQRCGGMSRPLSGRFAVLAAVVVACLGRSMDDSPCLAAGCVGR